MKFPPNLSSDDRTKMFASPKEKELLQSKEEGTVTNEGKYTKASSSSSRQWSAFKNPRIVRVSRTFGGKDRHSKVCTVRGLRDRRIRLSVPTAVQLYDLQEKLGLNQPSKVVDWLIDATKQDIDKLPPLKFPPGSFGQFHHYTFNPHDPNANASPSFNSNLAYMKDGETQSSISRKEGLTMNHHHLQIGDDHDHDHTVARSSRAWDSDATLTRAKCKEVVEKGNQENQDGIGANYNAQISAQNFFPTPNNYAMPFNPYYHWEPSNLSLCQFGGGHGFPSQTEDLHATTHSVPLPSPLALSSGSQLFLCPSAAPPSLFPPYPSYITGPVENDMRQMNHFQLMGSSSQPILQNPLLSSLHSNSSTMKSSSLSNNSKFLHLQSQSNNHSQQPK